MRLSASGLILAADSAIDLHLHTTYSDGRWTLEALLDYLHQEQLGLAAITDHDRVDTLAAIQQAALDRDLPVLVAVEMTDLLCFGSDPPHNAMVALLLAHGYGPGEPSAWKIALEAGCALATNEPAAVVEAAHYSNGSGPKSSDRPALSGGVVP